jgi:hypothetical protein
MEWIVCLGHGILGALLLPLGAASPELRRRAIELASVVGVALGVALVVAGEAGGSGWRTVAFEAGAAAPAGFAVTAAWIVTGALAHRSPRVAEAALTGVAASGLVLAATGRYAVPVLIFWLCSSAALAAGARPHGRRAWVVLAVSDAAVCAAATLHVWGEDTWAFDVGGGAAVAALVVAAVVRGGAHVVAPWPGLTTGARAAAPLMAGGAVALAARAGTSEPWVAAVLLVAALGAAAIALVRDSIGPAAVATWVTTLALAACFVSPRHAPLAGAAAVLAVAGAALWPYTAGRGGIARSLLVSGVPLTAGFGVVAGAGADAFGRATAGGGSAAWTIVAALVPVALGAGVALGIRAARASGGELVPEAVLATWLLVAAAIGTGVFPQAVGDAGVLGDSGGATALQLLALSAGAAAGIAARRPGAALEPGVTEVALAQTPPAELPREAAWAALALGTATAAAATWLTIAGLRVGFL